MEVLRVIGTRIVEEDDGFGKACDTAAAA